MDKKTIMLVEDDKFIVDIYETKLSHSGFNVIVANNGKEAVDLLAENTPDLMLLDLVMPYMDGFDVLKEMHDSPEWSKIPVILLTNLSQKEDIEKGMQLGAKDFLIKSHFTPSEVLKKIEALIG
jgi:DNA-binding response OmpR family regulator